MRVLLMTSSYQPVLGGLQTVTHNLSRYLLSKGHEVQVITNRYPRSLPSEETIDGLTVRRWLFLWPRLEYLRSARLDVLFASLFFCPVALWRLGRLLRSFQPDVMNVHFPDAQAPFVLCLRKQYPFRLVVSLHGHEVERWFTGERPLAGSRSLRAILRHADAVTACSRNLLGQAAQLEASVLRKGYVTPNGISPDRFQDETPYSYRRQYILAFGRLTHKKGFDLLLEAFARVGQAHPNVDLVLAGEGEDLEDLQELSARLSLGERVFFFGRADANEIVRLLNGCLFVVVPSRFEPFGIVALEALAAGRSVLATRVGGLEELLSSLIVSEDGSNKQRRAVAGSGFTDADDAELDAPRQRLATATRHVGSERLSRAALLVPPTVDGLREGLSVLLGASCQLGVPEEVRRVVLRDYSWGAVLARYETVLEGSIQEARTTV